MGISSDDIVQSAWIQTLNDNFDKPGQQQQPLGNTSYTEHCSDQSTTFDSVIQQHTDISDFFNNPQQQQQQQVVANNHDEQPLFTLTCSPFFEQEETIFFCIIIIFFFIII